MRLISALLVAVSVAGCAARERHLVRCEWPPEAAVAVDVKNPAQLRHLRADAQAAEALAVSYADSQPARETFGRQRQLTERCEAILFDAIARAHHVAPAQVRTALRRQNDTPF
jgi:hypothetical protein